LIWVFFATFKSLPSIRGNQAPPPLIVLKIDNINSLLYPLKEKNFYG